MSLRLEMLQVARLAPSILGESTNLVKGFLLAQRLSSGGFADRSGRADLYYTVFGLEGLLALQCEVAHEPTRDYLAGFGTGTRLDFVHLCCLARSWAGLATAGPCWGPSDEIRFALQEKLEGFRSLDGGFNPIAGAHAGTAYAAFLGVGALQDLGMNVSQPDRLLGSFEELKCSDGGWANEPGLNVSAANATAAVIAVSRQLGLAKVDVKAGEWLWKQVHPMGGFRAVPQAPIPDLLTTATALHALSGLQVDLGPIREACLDFVDSLWNNQGAFHGHWHEDHLDVEYSYYGLLALGHLAV